MASKKIKAAAFCRIVVAVVMPVVDYTNQCSNLRIVQYCSCLQTSVTTLRIVQYHVTGPRECTGGDGGSVGSCSRRDVRCTGSKTKCAVKKDV